VDVLDLSAQCVLFGRVLRASLVSVLSGCCVSECCEHGNMASLTSQCLV